MVRRFIVTLVICSFLVFQLFIISMAFAMLLNDLVKEIMQKGGGILVLAPGVYNIDPPLVIPHNVSLLGSGYFGPFEEKSKYQGTVLMPIKKVSGPLVYISPGYNGLIENLTIDGRWQVDVGIFVDGAQGAKFKRLAVIGSNVHGIIVKDSVFCRFEDIYVKYAWIGIELIGSPLQPTTLNLFSHCMFEGKYESVRLIKWVDNNWFENTRIISPLGGFGLAIEDGEEIYYNIFSKCTFEGKGTGIVNAISRSQKVCAPNVILLSFFSDTLSKVIINVHRYDSVTIQ